MTDLSVGVLTADLLRLGEELEEIARTGVTRLHVDVMDGVFCPEITVGPPFVKALPDSFRKDVHLMIDEPVGKVASFVDAGADTITFHLEATRHPHRVLHELADSGVTRGVALNPGTPLAAVEPLLDDVELVLVLAVDPGWRGQRFIPSTHRKLAAARELIADRHILLAVDGGITRENISVVASSDIDLIVTGSAIFDGLDAAANARFMLQAARGAANDDGRLGAASARTKAGD